MVEEIVGFFNTANNLKWTDRSGWVSKVFVKTADAESVADHCYLMAMMCMVVADLKKLNGCKAVRMALLHDLAESIMGDYMPEEISSQKKDEEENKAIKSILGKLPPKLRRSYGRLWKEYKSMSSKEAVLVNQIDKLEMALQASDYRDKGYDEELLDEFINSARKHVKDKTLLRILKSLKKGRT